MPSSSQPRHGPFSSQPYLPLPNSPPHLNPLSSHPPSTPFRPPPITSARPPPTHPSTAPNQELHTTTTAQQSQRRQEGGGGGAYTAYRSPPPPPSPPITPNASLASGRASLGDLPLPPPPLQPTPPKPNMAATPPMSIAHQQQQHPSALMPAGRVERARDTDTRDEEEEERGRKVTRTGVRQNPSRTGEAATEAPIHTRPSPRRSGDDRAPRAPFPRSRFVEDLPTETEQRRPFLPNAASGRSSRDYELGQRYTIASFTHPATSLPTSSNPPAFRRLHDEEVASLKGKSLDVERGYGEYDGRGKGDRGRGRGFWRQSWCRWMVVGVLWGVLCMVVGGVVGLLMRR